jgi:hypothetical protein
MEDGLSNDVKFALLVGGIVLIVEVFFICAFKIPRMYWDWRLRRMIRRNRKLTGWSDYW